jgi:transcriptional regulator with XRE-family HTH domain
MAKASKTPLGARLKETAQAAGLTAEEMAERLGTSPAAVWAWWSGRNEPALEMLVNYSRTVNRTLTYLATGEEEPFADWVLRFVEEVMSGTSPAAAFDAATGHPEGLSPRERRLLARRGKALRSFIEETAGRPWQELTAEERQAMVHQLIELAEE